MWGAHRSVTSYWKEGKPISNGDNFSILADENKTFSLEIKESLLTMRDKPPLNRNISSAPFYLFDNVSQWCHDVVVITTAQLHSTKPELRFCTGSNPARSVS